MYSTIHCIFPKEHSLYSMYLQFCYMYVFHGVYCGLMLILMVTSVMLFHFLDRIMA